MSISIRSAAGPKHFSPTAAPARFKLEGKGKVDIDEASDLVSLPGGRFLVVSDVSDRAALVKADGKGSSVKLPDLPNGKSQLEAVAYDPSRKRLFVVREEKGELLRYHFDPDKGAAKLEASLKLELEGRSNDGIEGMAFLSASHSPTGRPALLLAKEDKPMGLFIADDSGKNAKPIELDKKLKEALRDFSALTVDPRTGHLFVASDEDSAVAELVLERQGKKLVARHLATTKLEDENGKSLNRLEGVAFTSKGDLLVVLENSARMLHYKRR